MDLRKYPDRRYREGISQFRKYQRRYEKLKGRLERKLAAGTFHQLPVGTQRCLIRRYRALKARLERLRARILRIGGIAALSLAFAAFHAHADAPNPLELSGLDGSDGFVINGIEPFERSGYSVCSAGDVNGDGFDDLIIGALYADVGTDTRAGESYVVFGQSGGFGASLELSSLNGSNGFVINGIDLDDFSGRSVSGAGDVNGDGFSDLIIGASHADPNAKLQSGESYVVFGRGGGFGSSLELSDLDGSEGFVINGIDARDDSGRSVSGAGDVNGDGFDDLIIGAEDADPGDNGNAGESYVIFGGNFTGTIVLPTVLTIALNINGEFELQFIGVSGVEYTVEYSIDLENWNPVTSFKGTANSEYIVDDGAVGQPKRFYRVRGASGGQE